jgi:hypothetical protein
LDSYIVTCESYFDLDVSYHSKYFCIVLYVCDNNEPLLRMT